MRVPRHSADPFIRRLLLRAFAIGGLLAAPPPALAAPLDTSLSSSTTVTGCSATATDSLETAAAGGISDTFAESVTRTSTDPCDDEEDVPPELQLSFASEIDDKRRVLDPIDATYDLFAPELRARGNTRLNV